MLRRISTQQHRHAPGTASFLTIIPQLARTLWLSMKEMVLHRLLFGLGITSILSEYLVPKFQQETKTYTS